MTKVLLLTSDYSLEKSLSVKFMINGLTMRSTCSGGALIDQLKEADYDIVLLDDPFKDMEKTIYERGFLVPVLVLHNDDKEDFRALKKAMNEALMPKKREAVIEKGPLKLDLGKNFAQVKGKVINLGKMEFAILVSLVQKTGDIVGKEVMQADLAAQGQFFSRSIYHHIGSLKRSLKEIAGDTFKIQLVSCEGYRLVMSDST